MASIHLDYRGDALGHAFLTSAHPATRRPRGASCRRSAWPRVTQPHTPRLTSPGRPVRPTVFVRIFSVLTLLAEPVYGLPGGPLRALRRRPSPHEDSEGAGHLFEVTGGSFLCWVCQHEAVLTRVVTRGYMEWEELGVVSSEGKRIKLKI